MRIQKDEAIVLQADKVNSLARPASHSAHANVLLPKDESDRILIVHVHLVHAYPTGNDDETTVSKVRLEAILYDSEVLMRISLLLDLVKEDNLFGRLLLLLHF